MNIKGINKGVFIAQLETKVEDHLQKAVQIFQNLKRDQLSASADQMGWSIAQCLEHLNTYGDYYIPEINRVLDGSLNLTNEEFVSGWLGRYFVGMIDPDKSNKKYKAAKQHMPTSNLDPHQIVFIFISQQEEFLKILNRCYHADLNHIKVTTSISSLVRLRLGDILQFLIVHNERHIRQALRNLPL